MNFPREIENCSAAFELIGDARQGAPQIQPGSTNHVSKLSSSVSSAHAEEARTSSVYQ